jgi:hypothetical protein
MSPSSTSSSTAPTRAQPAGTGTLFTPAFMGRSPAGASDSVWTPLASGLLVLAAGAMSLATGQHWLTVGLGPTAVAIATTPGHRSVRFHAIVVGHAVAFACAFLAVVLLGASDAPLLSAKAIPIPRVWASAIAVALTALVQPMLRAPHAPAAATALLVALGIVKPTMRASLALLGGVLVVALLGEWLQRVRLRAARDAAGDAAPPR